MVRRKDFFWFSEVWSEGDQSKREESAPISLGAVLDQARLKVVLY